MEASESNGVDDGVLHPDVFSREFDRALKRLNAQRKQQQEDEADVTLLPEIGLHGLRHTWATLALKQGIAANVVQERLGHSRVGITLDIYTHVLPTMQADAAAKVAALFAPSR